MTTHELADALVILAKALRASPATKIDNIQLSTKSTSNQAVAVNLATLSELSRLDKQQWSSFVVDYKLPIEIRPRDASRDILGKLLNYLEENPAARERIRRVPEAGKTSAALIQAITSLLDV